ncbi:MAG: hypothetical protein AAFQ44_07525 [Pseudomonadota bacterium]
MVQRFAVPVVAVICTMSAIKPAIAQGQTVDSFLFVAPKRIVATNADIARADWLRMVVSKVQQQLRGSTCLDPELADAVRPLLGNLVNTSFVLSRSGDLLNVREMRDTCSSFILSKKALKIVRYEHLKSTGSRQWQAAFGYPTSGDTLGTNVVRLKLQNVAFSHLDPSAAARVMNPAWQRSVHGSCVTFKRRPGTADDKSAKCACIVNAALGNLTADAAAVFRAIYEKNAAWKQMRTRLTESEDTGLFAVLDRGKKCPETGGTATLAALNRNNHESQAPATTTAPTTRSTTDGTRTQKRTADISGLYAEIGSGQRIKISVWGNGYYYVEANNQRLTGYFDAARSTLSIYEGDPQTTQPIAVFARAADGSFQPRDGQGRAGFRPIDGTSTAAANRQNTTPTTGAYANGSAIVGSYSVNGQGQIKITEWGNSYFFVDWGGKRYKAYFDAGGGRLTLYDGEPNANSRSWVYHRQSDGSFKHLAGDGSVSVLTKLR